MSGMSTEATELANTPECQSVFPADSRFAEYGSDRAFWNPSAPPVAWDQHRSARQRRRPQVMAFLARAIKVESVIREEVFDLT